LENALSFTLIANGKKFVLPQSVLEWDETHVHDFIKARYSDERKAETSLCNLLTYGKAHSACNAVLSALEQFLQEKTGCRGDCMLTPYESRHLTPMINECLEGHRKRIGVIPKASLKVLVRT